jgi:hypothetical protein
MFSCRASPCPNGVGNCKFMQAGQWSLNRSNRVAAATVHKRHYGTSVKPQDVGSKTYLHVAHRHSFITRPLCYNPALQIISARGQMRAIALTHLSVFNQFSSSLVTVLSHDVMAQPFSVSVRTVLGVSVAKYAFSVSWRRQYLYHDWFRLQWIWWKVSWLNEGVTSAKKLALSSPISGGRSVGIVRLRTQTTEYFFCYFGTSQEELRSTTVTINSWRLCYLRGLNQALHGLWNNFEWVDVAEKIVVRRYLILFFDDSRQ